MNDFSLGCLGLICRLFDLLFLLLLKEGWSTKTLLLLFVLLGRFFRHIFSWRALKIYIINMCYQIIATKLNLQDVTENFLL